jgi:hypothetical protein
MKATKWPYENAVPADRLRYLSPDGWQHDQGLLDRSGKAEIQLDPFYDYRTNIPLYPLWQKAFRVATALASLGDAAEELAAKIVAAIPMGRLAEPAEIARPVVFLAIDDACYMTGAELVVDGRFTAA